MRHKNHSSASKQVPGVGTKSRGAYNIMSVCLSVCLVVWLSVCLSVCLNTFSVMQ